MKVHINGGFSTYENTPKLQVGNMQSFETAQILILEYKIIRKKICVSTAIPNL
jgi:hypothetical protein